jgi:uncharacterized membrane protein YdjX (TVP38/TMEM64 family)
VSAGDVPAAARPARLRLVLVAAAAVAAFLAFWVFDLLDEEDVRSLVDPFGALAAPAYVVIAALLGLAFVPGPLLAGTSGLLFGTALGTAVTLSSAILSAVLGLLIARRAVREPPQRLGRIADLAQRHGVVAVIVQRLIPGVPDAPANYAFGALGLRVWQIALGTLIGSAPRSFSYTSIGASLDDPSSPVAVIGVVVLVVVSIAGAELARRVLVKRR